MEKQFGTAYTNVDWVKKGPGSKFMKEFEMHKRDFGKIVDKNRYYEMALVMSDIPPTRHYDPEESTVKIYE